MHVDYEIRRMYHMLKTLKVDHDLALDILVNALDTEDRNKAKLDLAHHIMEAENDKDMTFYQTLRFTQESQPKFSVRKTCDAMGFKQFRYYSETATLTHDFVGHRDYKLLYITDENMKPIREAINIATKTRIL